MSTGENAIDQLASENTGRLYRPPQPLASQSTSLEILSTSSQPAKDPVISSASSSVPSNNSIAGPLLNAQHHQLESLQEAYDSDEQIQQPSITAGLACTSQTQNDGDRSKITPRGAGHLIRNSRQDSQNNDVVSNSEQGALLTYGTRPPTTSKPSHSTANFLIIETYQNLTEHLETDRASTDRNSTQSRMNSSAKERFEELNKRGIHKVVYNRSVVRFGYPTAITIEVIKSIPAIFGERLSTGYEIGFVDLKERKNSIQSLELSYTIDLKNEEQAELVLKAFGLGFRMEQAGDELLGKDLVNIPLKTKQNLSD